MPNAAHKTIIEECMQEGLLVPNHIVGEVLDDYIVRNLKQGNTYFLVDGFPRTVEQAANFDTRVSDTNPYLPNVRTSVTI